MKRILLVLLVASACAPQVSAQKSKMLNDMFTGKVVATNDDTREITLTYSGKDKTETFTGVLKAGYQVKMNDGSLHDLKVSELPPGERIRVFYKPTSREVNGQKVKVNVIFRVDIMGPDEFTRMRQLLKVDRSTPVTFVESKGLPGGDSLRLKFVCDDPESCAEFTKWVEEWNKQEARKYGKVEIVPLAEPADLALVIHRGGELPAAAILPMISVFLVVEKPAGLEVIWKLTYAPRGLFNSGYETSREEAAGGIREPRLRVTIELEKRLRARGKR